MKETRYKMMFVFIKKMLIGLSSACTIGSFGASLASNRKEPIKCVSRNINHVKLDQHLLI